MNQGPKGRTGRSDSVDRTLDELERSVETLIEGHTTTSDRLRAAEEQKEKLHELVRARVGDDADPDSFVRRYRELERRNAELRDRLEAGRAGIDRTLARLRFLEES